MKVNRISNFLWSNLETVIAILIVIGTTIFGYFAQNQTLILAGIGTTLGLLALAIVRDREARGALTSQINVLEKAVSQLSDRRISADAFFKTRHNLKPFSQRVQNARTLDIFGASLRGILIGEQGTLRDLKKSGAQIRLLISNPDNDALQHYLSQRFLESPNPTTHIAIIKTGLQGIAPLIGSSQNGGSIQIRATDTIQSFTCVGIDTSSLSGQILVEFYLNDLAVGQNPLFELSAREDPHWYAVWKNQFNILWDSAKDIDFTKIPNTQK